MAKIAYFDCFSGCSGDMILAALLDAGLPLEELKVALSKISITGYDLSVKKTQRASIVATEVKVTIDEEIAAPMHDLRSVLRLIVGSDLPPGVKEKGTAIFQRLAEAESKIHGHSIEKVHFHELGGVDSMIDIIGALIGFDALKIEQFYSSSMPLGMGEVSTTEGILPLPAPATLELLRMAHAPVLLLSNPLVSKAEVVTPTGAAIITSLACFERPSMILENVGYGAGEKDFGIWPNVMRLWIGEEVAPTRDSDLLLLETNIDDMNPEIYSYLMEKLLTQGVLDVWYTPIQMKKNRPATMVSVIVPRFAEASVVGTILCETSTLGIRATPVSRHICHRDVCRFQSSVGEATVKVKRFRGAVLAVSPEYEDCRRIALERNLPLHEVYRIVESESRQCLEKAQITKLDKS